MYRFTCRHITDVDVRYEVQSLDSYRDSIGGESLSWDSREVSETVSRTYFLCLVLTLYSYFIFSNHALAKKTIIMHTCHVYICASCKLTTDSALKLDQENGSCIQMTYHISKLSVIHKTFDAFFDNAFSFIFALSFHF